MARRHGHLLYTRVWLERERVSGLVARHWSSFDAADCRRSHELEA
jgi:hypothetical protein